MKLYGKVSRIQGNHVILDLDNEIDMERLNRYSSGNQPELELRLHDKREISNDQRKKCFALFGDISRWSGYSIFEVESWLKAYYMVQYGQDYFSLSNTNVTNAKDFIDYIIKFCFMFGIPFKDKTASYLRQDFTFQKQALLHRQCIIDGRKSEIDHWTKSVGSGRNRRKIDNTQFGFTSLCHNCHLERHQIGKRAFEEKYHIKIIPIKLNHKEIKKLNVGG